MALSPQDTSEPEDVAFRVILSVLVIINVLGNTLVILVILNNRSMKIPMNYLLLNLAVADMMVGIFQFPPKFLGKPFPHPTGIVGDFLCKFFTDSTLLWVGHLVSALSLVFIAVERYYAVMQPLNFKHKLTISKIKIILPVCWIASVVLNLPDFIVKSYNTDYSMCYMPWSIPWQEKAYIWLWFTLGGALPIAVMTALYTRVVRSLWFRREDALHGVNSVVLKSRKKITRMMLIVSSIYIVSCLPNYTLFLIFGIHDPVRDSSQIEHGPAKWSKHITDCLVLFNSSINPFVYSLQSERFNRSVKRLVRCHREKTVQNGEKHRDCKT